MRSRVIIAITALVAVVVCGGAAAAHAVTSSVRVEGATHLLLPTTTVSESGGTYVDTSGESYKTSGPTAFGALAVALRRAALPWDFGVSSFGVFVNSIAGQTMAPDYSNWWEFTVNGFTPPVGMADLSTEDGDRYVLFQNPDAGYPPHGGKLLVVRPDRRVVAPGQRLTLTVLGDDLAKVNSAADAARFDATEVETPAQFQPVTGAQLHVGSRVYDLTGSSLTLDDLPAGTYGVWADKAMDDSWVYARAQVTLVDVAPAPAIKALRVTPAVFRRGRPLRVLFTLNEAAKVRLTIRDANGRIVLNHSVDCRTGGAKAILWNGRTSAHPGYRLRITLNATDRWGRTGAARLVVPVMAGSR